MDELNRVFRFIRIGGYLVVAIVLAFLGLKFSVYGLMVNCLDNNLHEISIAELELEDLSTKRLLRITDCITVDNPLLYVDDNGDVDSYLYPIFMMDDLDTMVRLIIETKEPFEDVSNFYIEGLLKPYWFNIDDDIILEFKYLDIDVRDDAYYIDLSDELLKWYWYFIILFISVLFFYRMLEAAYKEVMKVI